jgi:hypothetical protein
MNTDDLMGWPFADPRNCAAIASRAIFEKDAPVLAVLHDHDGDWLFLDGSGTEPDDLFVVALGEVVKNDLSLSTFHDLPNGWGAERTSTDSAWFRAPFPAEETEEVIEDDSDEALLADISEQGWTVLLIEAEDEKPAFAYSVGLFKNYAHPEVIVFGLDLELMNVIVNEIGESVKNGKRFEVGRSYFGVIEKYGSIFQTVETRHYAEHFGFAQWFYKGDDFPAAQCCWPDLTGLYPWHEGFDPHLRANQPILADEVLLK